MGWLLMLGKPFLKSMAKRALLAEEDRLKDQLKAAVKEHGVEQIDKIALDAEGRINDLVEKTLPKWGWLQGFKAKIEQSAKDYAEHLRQQLDDEVVKNGPDAIDKIIDQGTQLLVAKIDAL